MVTSRIWGRYQNRDIALYTLTNPNGTAVSIIEFGGTVTSLLFRDRNGKLDDIVLGYDSLDAYVADRYYMGVILGRCANRIENPDFMMGEQAVHLSKNQGAYHLHGGARGFHKQIWHGQIVGDSAVTLQRVSPDGEEGYPGNLHVTVTYSLSENDDFAIRYTAVTDRDTIVSLSNHSYFNLSGADTIEEHAVMVDADYFVQIDSDCGSTGAILPVSGTPFDLRAASQLGTRIRDPHQQMKLGSGYNHTFVLKRTAGMAATVYSERSGRRMDVFTDQTGVHLYTGNYLDDVQGKQGKTYQRHGALCLETQNYPEAINMPHFPSPALKPGQVYDSKTVFKFTTI